MKRILALGAHTDDIELGAAGFLKKMIDDKETDFVSVVYMGLPPNVKRRPMIKEATAAMKRWKYEEEKIGGKFTILHYPARRQHMYRQEILDYLYTLRSDKYDLVLVPGGAEIHQDHNVVKEEAQRAFYDIAIYGYEHPMRTLPISHLKYVPLNNNQVIAKTEAVQKYESQLFRRGLQHRAIMALLTLRGCQVCTDFAESFEVIRDVS